MKKKFLSGAVPILTALFTLICSGAWIRTPDEPLLLISKSAVYAVFFYVIWIIYDADALDVICRRKKSNERDRKFFLCWSGKEILLTAIVLMLIYLVWLVLYYPGVCNADTANQIWDFFNGKEPTFFQWHSGTEKIAATLNDHHPVFDTLVFSFFYRLGTAVGSEAAGMFFYGLFQTAATAASFSVMLCSLERLGTPLVYRRLGFVFLACMPFIPMYVINMIKDSLYGFLFVFYFTVYILLVREGPSKKKLMALIFLSVLLSLTKKTGVYLVMFSNPALLFSRSLRKKAGWILTGVLLPAFVIFVLMGRFLFPLFDVYPGGKQEMLGLCMQQTAAAVLDHPDEISEEEQVIIDRVMEYDRIRDQYDPGIQDGVKKIYRFHASPKDIRDFLFLWAKMASRYPGSYLKALVLLTGGYFAPTMKIVVYDQVTRRGTVTWENALFTEKVRRQMNELYQWLSSLPGLGVLFTLVLYVWWIPLLAMIRVLSQRRFGDCLCFVPVIMSLGVLIICPYAGTRYALSQIYTVPLLIGLGKTKLALFSGK